MFAPNMFAASGDVFLAREQKTYRIRNQPEKKKKLIGRWGRRPNRERISFEQMFIQFKINFTVWSHLSRVHYERWTVSGQLRSILLHSQSRHEFFGCCFVNNRKKKYEKSKIQNCACGIKKKRWPMGSPVHSNKITSDVWFHSVCCFLRKVFGQWTRKQQYYNIHRIVRIYIRITIVRKQVKYQWYYSATATHTHTGHMPCSETAGASTSASVCMQHWFSGFLEWTIPYHTNRMSFGDSA